MDTMQISQHAHALYRAHGDSAEAEAARKSRESAARGDREGADLWRAIRASVRRIRGPLQK